MLLVSPLGAIPARAADGYWLDQYSALLYISTFNLDSQLAEMRRRGAKTVMVHADSLPTFILRFISWRAKDAADLQSVAWIQRPNYSNLARAGSLYGYAAIQIDDHFFNKPPVKISKLRELIGSKKLWCSFQPKQYSYNNAAECDHADIQIYRQSCRRTGDIALSLGAAGRADTAIAVYHDGSKSADEELKCMESDMASLGNKIFVFKWNNPEAYLKHVFKGVKSFARP